MNLQESNRSNLLESGRTVVVLDDDPTGTQTVFNVPVLTSWQNGEIRSEFESNTPVFYVLTNSRAHNEEEAAEINREIAEALPDGRPVFIVSRSDSTLRGHFPLETDILATTLQMDVPVLLIPFFEEGGRVTENDIHYVIEGDNRIPAAETPFAQDPVFGFTHSNLKDWVEEKSGGRIKAEDTDSITVGSVEDTVRQLRAVRSVGIVNATSMHEMETLVAAIHAGGHEFLFRTAGSFVRALAGLPGKDLLRPEDIVDSTGSGGLVIVGSHVPKSTRQLEVLRELDQIDFIEINDPGTDRGPVTDRIALGLNAGRVVVVYTGRALVSGDNAEESLAISHQFSMALVEIVKANRIKPRYIIAKGGITSSDIATDALGIRRATVLGQVLPGIPVWRSNNCHGFVVFPGNVGDDHSLKTLIEKLR